jgi:hypothetical protein
MSVLKNIGGGLTAGFVIGGSGNKLVLIRAVGPSLAIFGLGDLLSAQNSKCSIEIREPLR